MRAPGDIASPTGSRSPGFWTLPLVLAANALLASCATKSMPDSASILYEQPPRSQPLSQRVFLVADNQLNYLYGDPNFMRTDVADQAVHVAIRPVQQDLFGQAALEWAVATARHLTHPILHLGDALNVGCEKEWAAFLRVMDAGRAKNEDGTWKLDPDGGYPVTPEGYPVSPWYMAPGNHDAFFMGNTQDTSGEWDAACGGKGGALTKDELVGVYLQHLTQQHQALAEALQDETGQWLREGCIDRAGTCGSMPAGAGLLHGLAWRIDEEEPWRSYLVQAVDLTFARNARKVIAILFDSAQYDDAPTLIPWSEGARCLPEQIERCLPSNAGTTGVVGSDQLEHLETWAEAFAKDTVTILMSHHRPQNLRSDALDRVESLPEELFVPLYVSAHSHAGRYDVWDTTEGGALELNVGSMLDWPVEFRNLELNTFQTSDGTAQIGISTGLFRLPEAFGEAVTAELTPNRDDDWEVSPSKPRRPGSGPLDIERDSYYLKPTEPRLASLSPSAMQAELMRTGLASFARYLAEVPTDWAKTPKGLGSARSDAEIQAVIRTTFEGDDTSELIALLERLMRFDERRTVTKPRDRLGYRLHQALWAAKYDYRRGRMPDSRDERIGIIDVSD